MKNVKRTVISIILLLIAGTALSAGLFYTWKKFTRIQTEKKRETVTSQIEKVAELTVLKNTYSDVISIKKSAVAGLAKAYSIVKYTGVIRAGIKDFSRIKLNFSPDGKSIDVLLPHAEILGNGIIEQEVFDEKTSIFVPITTQEIFDEIASAMSLSEDRLIHSGYLIEADVYAKQLMSAFLTAAGYEEINIEMY